MVKSALFFIALGSSVLYTKNLYQAAINKKSTGTGTEVLFFVAVCSWTLLYYLS